MLNICTKYGFDILIISGSYGGHRRHTTYDGRRTTDDGRRTTPRVWHKLPTGELIIQLVAYQVYVWKLGKLFSPFDNLPLLSNLLENETFSCKLIFLFLIIRKINILP